MSLRLLIVACSLAAAGPLAASAPALAQDPAPWTLSGVSAVDARFGRGLAPGAAGSILWAGPLRGAWRTGADLRLDLRLAEAIPPELRGREGWDRVGDPGWDPAAGRLVLPLGCAPGACARPALAFLGGGLRWSHHVPLDPADVPSVPWAEVSPDGALVWTSSGTDLVAYRLADLTPAASPDAAPRPRPARRLAGVLPGPGAGGAFADGRLLVAEATPRARVWSVDVRDGAAPDVRVAADLGARSIGTPRGLAAVRARGGLLQLLATAGPDGGAATLASFVPPGDGALRLTVRSPGLRAGRPAALRVGVRQRLDGREDPIDDVLVTAAGSRARTDERGEAELRVRPRGTGTLVVRATREGLSAPPVTLRVQFPVGPPLSGPTSARISAGAGARRLRAQRLIDCSGQDGCDSGPSLPRVRGCVPARRGADLRIALALRPARTVTVLIEDAAGRRVVDGGRAASTGRSGLGWRFPIRGRLPDRARLTLIPVYPDGTGALTVTRLRGDGRC